MPGIEKCENGRLVYIKPRYWAGLISNTTGKHYVEPLSFVETYNNDRNTPTSRNVRLNNDFIVAECYNGLCNPNVWQYNRDSPCLFNGDGPLCGKCEPGASMKLASAVSNTSSLGADLNNYYNSNKYYKSNNYYLMIAFVHETRSCRSFGTVILYFALVLTIELSDCGWKNLQFE